MPTSAAVRRRSRPNRVTSKGQVTIPAEVRRAIGIRPGDAVDFIRSGQDFVVRLANVAAEDVARQMGYPSAAALANAVEEGAASSAGRDLQAAKEWSTFDAEAEAEKTWERHRQRKQR